MMQYLDRFYFWTQRTKWKAWLIMLAVTAGMIFFAQIAQAVEMQQELSRQVIRFHVTASGNTLQEQQVKETVRDAVNGELDRVLQKARTVQEAQAALGAYLPELEEKAQQIVLECGRKETVHVTLHKEWFPTRISAGTTLPAGEYETLRITIGEGEGHNWWYILFPEWDCSDPGEEEPVENQWVRSEEQTSEVKMRFWLLEWWEEWSGSWFGATK